MQPKNVRMIVACQNRSRLLINPFAGAQLAMKNRVKCPTCRTFQLMPDTFYDHGQLLVIPRQTPIHVLRELHEIVDRETPPVAADRIRKEDKFAWLRPWIPDSPERMNTYLSILAKLLPVLVSLALAGKLAGLTLEKLIDDVNRRSQATQVERAEE